MQALSRGPVGPAAPKEPTRQAHKEMFWGIHDSRGHNSEKPAN